MELQRISKDELKEILEQHTLWIRSREKEGSRAALSYKELSGADISEAELSRADLTGANLPRADLADVNLLGANLCEVNLYGANLTGANLSKANLTKANLSRANLPGAALANTKLTRANLYSADLSDATLFRSELREVELSNADLSRTDLAGSNLHGANLSNTILHGTNINGANLQSATLARTVFARTNLSEAGNLATCVHFNSSTIDHATLSCSGALPFEFLRGCGLNDWEIEATKLYRPELTREQITDITYEIDRLCSEQPLNFYSCFISYSSEDDKFARKLHADLQDNGVRCWFAPEDMKIGDKIRDRIETVIHVHDRLLLILSEESINSQWVESEVESALRKERHENRTVLFPVRLDDEIMKTKKAWATYIKDTRNIGDFTGWQGEGYSKTFEKLLKDLRANDRPKET